MPVSSPLPGLVAGIALLIAAPARASIDLQTAVRLALAQQPRLEAQAARARAADARGIAAGALPDPEFIAGLENLSVERPDPYAADAEGMTMTQIGIMQAFPNAAKRRQLERSTRLDAARIEAEQALLQRAVVRDVSLAWIEVWRAQQALTIVEHLARETARALDARRIAQRSGRDDQDATLAAELANGLVDDRRRALAQALATARAGLARWTGRTVDAVTGELPTAMPASLEAALARVGEHPELQALERAAERSGADVELARAAYRPDWRLQAMYGYRRPYDDMFSVQVGIDLPLFTARRQDPALAAARAEYDAAKADAEDARRALLAELQAAWGEQALVDQRLSHFETRLLPVARLRVDSALAAYGGGRGTLAAVFDARVQALDIELKTLDLAAERARLRTQLRYLTGDDA
ncbi:TolC family protein [Sinimarinibacterium thermocellulolyticum]|uniref:TolC family protein n=1 Tax=Sinimarinibacterium thermocellulolyticum TaxID=3170016 RepID=A0ABV2A9P1_9GAMM